MPSLEERILAIPVQGLPSQDVPAEADRFSRGTLEDRIRAIKVEIPIGPSAMTAAPPAPANAAEVEASYQRATGKPSDEGALEPGVYPGKGIVGNLLTGLFDPGVLLDPSNLAGGAGAGAWTGRTAKAAVKGAVDMLTGGYGLLHGFGKGVVKGLQTPTKGPSAPPAREATPSTSVPTGPPPTLDEVARNTANTFRGQSIDEQLAAQERFRQSPAAAQLLKKDLAERQAKSQIAGLSSVTFPYPAPIVSGPPPPLVPQRGPKALPPAPSLAVTPQGQVVPRMARIRGSEAVPEGLVPPEPSGVHLTFKNPQIQSRFMDAAKPAPKDYLAEFGVQPADEANRELLNRIISLESGGNPKAVNLKTKSGKDSGLFQFKPANVKRFGVNETSPVEAQVRAAEKRLAELPTEIGLDPTVSGADRARILATAWLAPARTREALARVTPRGRQSKGTIAEPTPTAPVGTPPSVPDAAAVSLMGGLKPQEPTRQTGLPLEPPPALRTEADILADMTRLQKSGQEVPSALKADLQIARSLRGGAGRGSEELAAMGSRQQPAGSTFWTKAELRPEHREAATEIATEYLRRQGVTLDREPSYTAIVNGKQVTRLGQLKRPLIDQLVEVMDPNKTNLPVLEEVAKGQGKTVDQFWEMIADASHESVSGAAKTLNWQKQMAARLAQQAGETPGQQRTIMARLANIWRASLIGQAVTTIRNVASTSAYQGFHAFTDTIDVALNKIVGLNRLQAQRSLLDPLKDLATTVKTSRSNRATVEQLLAKNPTLKGRLYGGYMSDVPVTTPQTGKGPVNWLLSTWERALGTLNAPNKATEFYARDIAFLTDLKARLSPKGIALDPQRLSQLTGKERQAFVKDLEGATQHALKVTFATSPPKGSAGDHLLKFYYKIPFPLVSEIPFPRFLYNAGKFTLEHTLWPVNLMRPSTLQAVRAGDTTRLSKAVAGASLFAAALAIRNSDYAGERFNEVKRTAPEASGKTRYWDLMPYNPWSNSLFVADVVTKFLNKEPQKLDLREVMKGLVSINLRVGTSGLVADKVFDLLGVGYEPDGSVTQTSARRFLRGAQEFAGELTAGFGVPLLNLKAITAAFDPKEAVMRDKRAEPFMGPIKNVVPFAGQSLPIRYSPTASKAPKIENPLGKHAVAGARALEKTPAQQALDRHGILYRNVLPPQGTRELESEMAYQMGPLVERVVTQIIQSPQYMQAPFTVQTAMLTEAVRAARGAAKPAAIQRIPPEAQKDEQVRRTPAHLRPLLR